MKTWQKILLICSLMLNVLLFVYDCIAASAVHEANLWMNQYDQYDKQYNHFIKRKK